MITEESLGNKLIKKSFWLYLFGFLVAPTGYLIRIIVSNDLSVSDIGIIYGVLGFVTLLATYNDFGLTETLKYYLPRFYVKNQNNHIKTAIVLSLSVQVFTGIILGSLVYFGSDYLALNYFHEAKVGPILKMFCFYFFCINLVQVISNIFISLQDTFSQQLVDLVRMRSIAAFSFLFFLLGVGSTFLYTISWLIGIVIAIFVGSYIFLKKYKNLLSGKIIYDKETGKEYFKYALRIFIGANAGTLLGQIDQQMIIYYLGTEKAGYYSNFLSLGQLYIIFVGPLFGFLMPLISEIKNKDQKDKLILLNNFFYKYFSLIGISIGGVFSVLGPVIAVILFGEKFLFSGQLLQILGLFIIFNNLLSYNFTFLSGIGKVKINVITIIIASLVNIVINLALIPTIGSVGGVISMIVGRIIMFGISYHIINKDYKISFDYSFFGKNLIMILVYVLILNYFHDYIFTLDDTHRLNNLINIIGIGSLYILYIGGINIKELKLFKNEIMKLKLSNKK